jgi:hypothetical protein
MAQPLLDFLTGRARAALPFMRKAAAAGVTAANALDVLRAFGVGFQTQAFYDVYNALLGKATIKNYLRIVPETVTLPYEAHAVNPVRQRTNYEYVLEIFHPPTGHQQYITVGSAIPLSQLQLKAQADAIFSSEAVYEVEQAEYPDSEVTVIEANVATGVQ